MDTSLSALLEASINIELNAGRLYRLYAELFADDSEFWRRMWLEEMNHAALLKSARQFLSVGKLPDMALYPDMEVLRSMNSLIKARIEDYMSPDSSKPARLDAYRFALELETSAAEGHFQDIMQGEQEDRVIEIFRKLAGGDLDHAKRIEALIRSHEQGLHT